MKEVTDFDAIVVGSGMTGGWAAKELTELGLRTLMLEAGRAITPERDFVEHKPPWDMPFRGLGDRRAVAARQSRQRNSVSFDEWSHVFWTDDVDNPYTTPPDRPFYWFRARQVGGKSTIWSRQVYRWSDLDFEANVRDGIAIDWPIRYADIAPWYDHVERFIGVSGQAEGLAHLPDGQFLPPMALNCVEQHVKERMRAHFGRDRVLTIGRVANLTVPHLGRAPCHYCGPCHRGCITLSYFSSVNATLPAAQATGRFTLRPFSVVRSLIHDPQKNRVTGVRVIDAVTKTERVYTGRIVFLCASALESARILLNSGLANSSDQVGRNIMDHIKWGGASGEFDGWTNRRVIGERPNGIYVPRFRNVASRHPDFIRGYGFQGEAGRAGWGAALHAPGIGAALKARVTELGPWSMTFWGFGEVLPRRENRATLHPTLVDKWGIPTLHIECQWSDNDLAIHRDMNVTAAELLESAGAKHIEPSSSGPSTPGGTNHEMGSARMGRDPKTSVLNGWNQSWDVPNVFVTDGAAMTSSGCQNPSLTYMALTARACHYAVDQMKKGEI
ncbi:MAG TPA: GMC family oxidoreductase [Gemmatimonadales bacterium]|jgi:choline dehydrogenase-like flavoprotein|nr:GMC family oxidoreductase [Gemmatimonadales bacterium]